MSTESDFEHAKEQFANDLKSLAFTGMTVTGQHGLVSIDLARAKLMIRRARNQKPFCYINLPTENKHGGNVAMSEAISKAVMHPKLKGQFSLDMMDDFTTTMWAYIGIRLSEHPVDFRQIKLSPEFF
jgi:hypothetical protein